MQLYRLNKIDAEATSVSRVKPDAEGDIWYIRNPAHDGPAIGQTYLDESVIVHRVGNVSYIFLDVHDAASLFVCHFLILTFHKVLTIRIFPAQCVCLCLYVLRSQRKVHIVWQKFTRRSKFGALCKIRCGSRIRKGHPWEVLSIFPRYFQLCFETPHKK